MSAVVKVNGVAGQAIYEFMLNCTDDDYRNWWPGTHLAFHTRQRFPNNLGNLVYFDEYVGRRRLKFEGVVVKHVPGKAIVWQMKKMIRLPAWLSLEIEESDDGVVITHAIKAGFLGVGRLFDPFLKLYLNKRFGKDLEDHARLEFTKLAMILSGRY